MAEQQQPGTAMTPAAARAPARQSGNGFGAVAATEQRDSGTAALRAQATAEVQARYLMAQQRPRDLDAVYERIARDCSRPGFAAVARYRRPVGRDRDGRENFAEGPSIRLIEAFIRHMGNLDVRSFVVYEDDDWRTVRVQVVDLETLAGYTQDVQIGKTVERARPRDSDDVVGHRTNSRGQQVYIVKATDDALLIKQAALVSKAIRTCAQRLVPADLLDEAQRKAVETLEAETKRDPDAAKRLVIDSFRGLGVTVADLKGYLGHPVDQCSPAELGMLRGVWTAIRDGELTWAGAVEAAAGPAAEAAPPAAGTPPAGPGGVAAEAVRAALGKRVRIVRKTADGGERPVAPETTTSPTPVAAAEPTTVGCHFCGQLHPDAVVRDAAGNLTGRCPDMDREPGDEA